MDQEPYRIVVADDEPHVRAYLKSVVSLIPANVVGEAVNGEEACQLYQQLRPDLLLMDLNMPIKTGEQALRDIIEEFPDARIIVFSSVSDRSLIDRCCAAGATNFVLKDCSVPEMVEIIRDSMTAK